MNVKWQQIILISIAGSALSSCAGLSLSPSSFVRSTVAENAIVDKEHSTLPFNSMGDTWRRSVEKVRLPRAGCYEASYPKLAWTSVPCVAAPKVHTSPPTRSSRSSSIVGSSRKPFTAGGGSDFTLGTGSNIISSATGQFAVVNDLTSESTTGGVNCDSGCAGANAYSLQINSGYFTTPYCNGVSSCSGWEQFVFQNPPGTGTGSISLDEWLIDATSCPSGFTTEPNPNGTDDCQKFAASTTGVPNQQITNLQDFALSAIASSSGDSVFLYIGASGNYKDYAFQNGLSDTIGLASNWTDAQFNVMGTGNEGQATFNSGASVEYTLEADDNAVIPPSACVVNSKTGESNNFTYVKAPVAKVLPDPSILLFESVGGDLRTATCSVSGSTLSAYASSSGDSLSTYTPSGTANDLQQGMMAGTNPSVVALDGNGDYEEAFQANTGVLIVIGNGGNINTGVSMASGTSPAIAAIPFGGFEVAFEGSNGDLYSYNISSGATDLHLGMMGETSPSITNNGGYEMAFQTNTGYLYIVNPSTKYNFEGTTKLLAGTSPAITTTTAGIEVAYQGANGYLYTYGSSSGNEINTGQQMRSGTSPAIAENTLQGDYEIAFQASNGNLGLLASSGSSSIIGLGMMAATSPTIAPLDGGGYEAAFQANSGILWVFNTPSGNGVDTNIGMASGTSPSIAP